VEKKTNLLYYPLAAGIMILSRKYISK